MEAGAGYMDERIPVTSEQRDSDGPTVHDHCPGVRVHIRANAGEKNATILITGIQ